MSGDCVFSVRIESGWRAQIVNVWSYEVVIRAKSPDSVAQSTQYTDCEEARVRHANSSSPSSYFARIGRCWVRPGEAMVTYKLKGKSGW